jgi:hypothetical protein
MQPYLTATHRLGSEHTSEWAVAIKDINWLMCINRTSPLNRWRPYNPPSLPPSLFCLQRVCSGTLACLWLAVRWLIKTSNSVDEKQTFRLRFYVIIRHVHLCIYNMLDSILIPRCTIPCFTNGVHFLDSTAPYAMPLHRCTVVHYLYLQDTVHHVLNATPCFTTLYHTMSHISACYNHTIAILHRAMLHNAMLCYGQADTLPYT